MDYGDSLGLLSIIAGVGSFISLVLYVAVAAGLWKIFEKAGKPGWAGIIPFYNIYIWLEVTGRPSWWIWLFVGGVVLSIVPILNFLTTLALFVLWIIMSIDMAKSFNKDIAWGIGIAFLGFVFLPMLGFGEAQYKGPENAAIPGISGES